MMIGVSNNQNKTHKSATPLKINMEPKNGGLGDDFPFQGGDFHVPCISMSENSGKRKFFMKPFSEGEPGSLPIGSMYGIFTYIYHNNQPNVVKYTIHGSYGLGFYPKQKTTLDD